MSERHCTACGATNLEGFLLDRGKGADSRPQDWYEGTPERGFLGLLKTRGHRHGPVVARRCRKCGHLDLWVPKIED